jgi:hypothetical protein
MTLCDHVVWNGHQFPGHWSWIYVARNDPAIQRNPHLAMDGRRTPMSAGLLGLSRQAAMLA